MKARYVRVSTPDQKLERQLVNQHPNEKLYIDVCSGSIPFNERPQATKLLQEMTTGTLFVKSIDRLGRNLMDILTTIHHFNGYSVSIKVENLGIESLVDGKPNQVFNLIISVLANIAEMERSTMLERQREGIAIAKAKGTYKGRVRGSTELPETVLKKYPKVVKYLKEGQSLRNVAKLSDVSLGTVQKVKKLIMKLSNPSL